MSWEPDVVFVAWVVILLQYFMGKSNILLPKIGNNLWKMVDKKNILDWTAEHVFCLKCELELDGKRIRAFIKTMYSRSVFLNGWVLLVLYNILGLRKKVSIVLLGGEIRFVWAVVDCHKNRLNICNLWRKILLSSPCIVGASKMIWWWRSQNNY